MQEKDISITRPSWTRILLLAGAVTTIGCSLPVGYNIGVVNTPAEILRDFSNASVWTRYHTVLNNGQLMFLWSCIVSIFLVGGTVGSLGGSFLSDKIGRKGALIASSLVGVMAGVLFFSCRAANSVEMLLIGRLLIGVSSGLITSVMPMYLTELAPKALRGSMGVLCPLGVTFGVLVAQVMSLSVVLGTEKSWPFLLAFYLLPLCPCTAILFCLPESPKYLFVIRKQPHVALKQLARIRNIKEEYLNGEVQELKLEEQDNAAGDEEAWSVLKVLKDKTLLLPLLLVCSLQAGQQFSGINAVFYYSTFIFTEAGLSQASSQLGTIGAGCCNLAMAIVSIYVMKRFNRRATLQVSLISTALSLAVLGLAVTFVTAYPWVPSLSIAAVLSFVICYGIALGPIPYFIGSELFEVGPRPAAMALGSMANWGGNFFVGLCFPSMQQAIGASSFYIFAAIVVALYLFIWYYLPETRGRTPTETAHLCKNGLASRPLESPVHSASTDVTYPMGGDTKEV